MKSFTWPQPWWLGGVSVFAMLFGLLTIKEGGSVLFVDGEARRAAGNYVPFVLWFNFLAGFIYVIGGAGLWLRQRWAVWLAFLIAGATLLVFSAFGIHILLSGAFESRTIVAMSLRTGLWTLIAVFGYRALELKGSE